MTDSVSDVLRREMELRLTLLAGEIRSVMQFGGTVQGLTKQLIAIYEMGCASQKRRDAAIARNPYCDGVGALGGDEPFKVGEKIAQAIEAGITEERDV